MWCGNIYIVILVEDKLNNSKIKHLVLKITDKYKMIIIVYDNYLMNYCVKIAFHHKNNNFILYLTI